MKNEKKTAEMLSYVRGKYPEEQFEVLGPCGGHLGSNVTGILVRAQHFPGKEVRVMRVESKGAVSYEDTYLGVKFEKETRDLLEARLRAAFGDAAVLYAASVSACTRDGSAETTLSEYLADWSSHVRFSAVITGAGAKDPAPGREEIMEIFRDLSVQGDLFFISDGPASSSLSDPEIRELIAGDSWDFSVSFWMERPGELTAYERRAH